MQPIKSRRPGREIYQAFLIYNQQSSESPREEILWGFLLSYNALIAWSINNQSVECIWSHIVYECLLFLDPADADRRI